MASSSGSSSGAGSSSSSNNMAYASSSSSDQACSSRNSGNKNGGSSGMQQHRKGDRIRCAVCGSSHLKAYWYQHILSKVHKNAVRQKRDLHSVSDGSLQRGIILRKVDDNSVYDILFTLNDENRFTRPLLTSVNEAESEETMHAAQATIESFFAHFRQGILERLDEALVFQNAIKVHCSLSLNIQKYTSDGQIIYDDISLRTSAVEIFLGNSLTSWFSRMVQQILIKYEENQHRGSNWSLLKINDFELHISKFSPLFASSYIPLPLEIQNKKAVINVQNFNDQRCFQYAILSKLLHEHRPKITNLDRVSRYTEEYKKMFNFNGITFPTPLSEIKIFEKNNEVSVNVYGLTKADDKHSRKNARGELIVYPIRVSEKYIKEKHFNLLYVQDENLLPANTNWLNGHYCCIIDLSRLINAQNNNHQHRIHICHRCLQSYQTENKLLEHEHFCQQHAPIRSIMPSEESKIQTFKNFSFQQRIPYIIYADFECALIPFSIAERQVPVQGAFTEKRHLHQPTSYCYYIVSCNERDETEYKPQLYRGPNAVQHFWKHIQIDLKKISQIYSTIIPINITDEDRQRLIEETRCHICGAGATPSSNIQTYEQQFENNGFVVDHCHLTGRVRGWACNACNINYKLPTFVPIVLHNGSNYDFKMLIREIYTSDDGGRQGGQKRAQNTSSVRGRRVKRSRQNFILDEASADEDFSENEEDGEDVSSSESSLQDSEVGRIKVIARNAENFISFSVGITTTLKARFIDSFRFMSSSLASLANNLNASQLSHVSKFFQGDLFDLAKRKGVFPYEYVRSFDQYEDTQLPPIEAFFSILNGEGISEDEYDHAVNVFGRFNCQTLGEYNDIYLTIDVLLLADVFENFRNLCLEVYNLDAAWHYSAPGLAWNSMLKVTKIELELLTDFTMFMFYEASIRGGYCAASERFVKANNPDLPDYDANELENRILYIDANNLYGDAMSAPLPLNGFQWLTAQEIDELDIQTITVDSPVGYILEVDLEYPKELHSKHNDYPYCPEHLKTSKMAKVPRKLIATLHDKCNYIVHYRYLQSALRDGLKLQKIHRGIKFNQSRWMQPYINLNNERRKVATTQFAKDYHKLMNNSCFGKFLESIRKRRSYILTNNKSQLLKNIRKPTFKRRVILNEETNLVLIEQMQTKLVFDKFIQAGGAILDISKTVMYDFHYDVMKSKIFPTTNISLAYTDTDSFIYNIPIDSPGSSLTKYLLPHKVHFDFSDYPRSHPLYDPTNKKILGKMKDEVLGKQISRFCALKAKLYSFEVESCQVVKKAKGIRKNVIEKSLTFQNYLDCLRNNERTYRTVTSIRSFSHQIFTLEQNKIALCMRDDKRYILPNGIHTLAWGHYDIPRESDIIYRYNFNSDEESEDSEIDEVASE